MSDIFGFLLVIVVLRWTVPILPAEKFMNIPFDCNNCKKNFAFIKEIGPSNTFT